MMTETRQEKWNASTSVFFGFWIFFLFLFLIFTDWLNDKLPSPMCDEKDQLEGNVLIWRIKSSLQRMKAWFLIPCLLFPALPAFVRCQHLCAASKQWTWMADRTENNECLTPQVTMWLTLKPTGQTDLDQFVLVCSAISPDIASHAWALTSWHWCLDLAAGIAAGKAASKSAYVLLTIWKHLT